MGNILSLTTFIPLLGALILALFLRGDDAAAQRNAKWVALIATTLSFIVSILPLCRNMYARVRVVSSKKLYVAVIVKFDYLTMFIGEILVPICSASVFRIVVYQVSPCRTFAIAFDLAKRDPSRVGCV